MNAEPDLARLASTVGDPRRIQMLALLMEGRALTAKELALGAGLSPPQPRRTSNGCLTMACWYPRHRAATSISAWPQSTWPIWWSR